MYRIESKAVAAGGNTSTDGACTVFVAVACHHGAGSVTRFAPFANRTRHVVLLQDGFDAGEQSCYTLTVGKAWAPATA